MPNSAGAGQAISASQGVSDALVRRELRDILSQSEYNHKFGTSPTERFWDWFTSLIQQISAWLGQKMGFGSSTAGRVLSIVFACLVIAAFIWLLAVVIRKLARRIGRAGETEDSALAGSYDLPSSGPLMREAARGAEAGDYRRAFRCAYLASISQLDEAGAVRYERSRTNWEYLRDLDQDGRAIVLAALRPITLDFDRKFYGREECGLSDYERALDAYSVIAREVAT